MSQFRVYRNIATPIKFMGLELIDIGVLTICFLVVFNVSDHLFINVAILFGFGFVLRYFKKDKPAGFAMDLILFLISAPCRHVSLKDRLPIYPAHNKSGRTRDTN